MRLVLLRAGHPPLVVAVTGDAKEHGRQRTSSLRPLPPKRDGPELDTSRRSCLLCDQWQTRREASAPRVPARGAGAARARPGVGGFLAPARAGALVRAISLPGPAGALSAHT